MKTLKAKLSKKLKKNGGFTLVEMLIVVAIIAILIAISIPTVTNSLNKAKEATDAANVRAACAEAIIEYLTDEATDVPASKYDAPKGKVVGASESVEAYGKASGNTDKIVWVKVDGGTVSWNWSKPDAAPTDWKEGTPTDLS